MLNTNLLDDLMLCEMTDALVPVFSPMPACDCSRTDQTWTFSVPLALLAQQRNVKD